MSVIIPTNSYQTPITTEWLEQFPDEVQEQFLDFIDTVPMLKWMISENRPRAKDLPRDQKGRIIVDITHPHILENMDYFRPAAKFYQENGCYTFLKPNANPNSEYGKWFNEEVRRCREGYVRESDGEWVTGLMYYYLNYSPIMLNRLAPGSDIYVRVEEFPDFWEGIYYRYHYADQARHSSKHCMELARRGCSKSYSLASMMTHNLLLGENEAAKRRVTTVLTAYTKEYLGDKDGTLSKFTPMVDFAASNTEFPRLMLTRRTSEMIWKMGYKNVNGNQMGSLNSVMGLSVKDDEGKIRGKRGFILFEEMGNYPNFKEVWDNVRDSVKEGSHVFSLLYAVGTAGDDESDFSGIKTILYNPGAYEVYALDNVYDQKGKGTSKFAYFFPSYISRAGCMDKDGNSDVVLALMEILMERYMVKQGGDAKSLLSRIAQMPITPAEAILKVKSNFFPVVMLNERIRQLDMDPRAYDDVYVGTLADVGGKVEFRATDDVPIRKWPVDNTEQGALEIYEMPCHGPIPTHRYIIGVDPVDNDQAESSSLFSCFVFDLFTDSIVAEYTGRKPFANDNYEIVRLLCVFYNATCLYEAHPYDQKVRLPDGTTIDWGDVKVGQELFAPNGKTVRVTDIPMDGYDDIYRVTFADGRTVEASAGHIWSVYKFSDRYRLQNLTTKQMYDAGVLTSHRQKRFFVPESGAVCYEHREVPIEPYIMGLLLAEGALTKFKKQNLHNKKRNYVQVSSSFEDAEFYKSVSPYTWKHIGNKGVSWHIFIDDIYSKLYELGLIGCSSKTKFIPDLYLFNDYQTRLELLKGLMDGDGCASHKGACVYITTSRRLADDVMLLCRGLGIKVIENAGREETDMVLSTDGKRYHCSASYRLAIGAKIPIFKLPRKIERQHVYTPNKKGSKAQGILDRNGIANIEYIGWKRCKCVSVDSEDGLYLIDDYVTTHNCNKKGLFSYFATKRSTWMLADCPDYLRERQLVKYSMFGSAIKGVNVNASVNLFANGLIKDWLNKTYTVDVKDEKGEIHQEEIPQLYRLRNRALIQELISYAPEVNTDRVSALAQVMLYREHFIVLYGGSPSAEDNTPDEVSDDDFFDQDWKRHLEKLGPQYKSTFDL